MSDFIPGLKLGELFFATIVQPILTSAFPDLVYSAALIGDGSEILGYDTELSTDHHWGPRAMLFLEEGDFEKYEKNLRDVMSHQLPLSFGGYSTHYSGADDHGVKLLESIDSYPINHRVEVYTMKGFFAHHLGVDPFVEPSVADWLTFAQQKLLTVTAGQVYHDGLGQLEAIRTRFAYYPHDVWLYMLAAQWTRISQEMAFMGRAGDVGDELGSQLVAARLVRDMMNLCFLMERRYAPYTKWFGTGFSHLKCAQKLDPILQAAIFARGWRERESYLVQAYVIVGELHNELGMTSQVEVKIDLYHERPYRVVNTEDFVGAILEAIEDEQIRALPPIGGVNQFVDSTDMLEVAARCRQLRVLFEPN
jgi:hypothetical protein